MMVFINGEDELVASLVGQYIANGWRIVRNIYLDNGHRVVRMVKEEE